MNFKPRKRFGQNFLRDQNYIQRIVDVIDLQKSDHCVEIGPGLGALTTRLVSMVDRFDAIELDRDLAAKLQLKFRDVPTCKIHQADALDLDFATLGYDDGLLRIVGNLPYNISTPLLFHVIKYANIVKDMHFMLQREVAWRLAACPCTKAYGRLSVMVQYYCDVELLFDVSPEAFSPKPAVHSSFVRLQPFAKPVVLAKDISVLQNVVTHAFNQRRKIISNSLKELITTHELESLEISSQLRPEQLTLEQFVRISNIIADKSCK